MAVYRNLSVFLKKKKKTITLMKNTKSSRQIVEKSLVRKIETWLLFQTLLQIGYARSTAVKLAKQCP